MGEFLSKALTVFARSWPSMLRFMGPALSACCRFKLRREIPENTQPHCCYPARTRQCLEKASAECQQVQALPILPCTQHASETCKMAEVAQASPHQVVVCWRMPFFNSHKKLVIWKKLEPLLSRCTRHRIPRGYLGQLPKYSDLRQQNKPCRLKLALPLELPEVRAWAPTSTAPQVPHELRRAFPACRTDGWGLRG